jgi:hypothetical protein
LIAPASKTACPFERPTRRTSTPPITPVLFFKNPAYAAPRFTELVAASIVASVITHHELQKVKPRNYNTGYRVEKGNVREPRKP